MITLQYKHKPNRYNKSHYDKRINQNNRMQQFLIDLIEKHKEKNFPWTQDQLIKLKNEDLAEIAVVAVNKSLQMMLGKGQDCNDGSDVKCIVSQHRNNIKKHKHTGLAHWTNSFTIQGVNQKIGALRVVAYNIIADDFEFFYIPRRAFNAKRIEIIIERFKLKQGQKPNFTGKLADGKKCKWYVHRCKTFEEMATKKSSYNAI